MSLYHAPRLVSSWVPAPQSAGSRQFDACAQDRRAWPGVRQATSYERTHWIFDIPKALHTHVSSISVNFSSEKVIPRMAAPSERPASPSASFYDMSDDDEGDYSTIRQSSEPSKGVKLLYAKSKVYMHPSSSAKDNVPGFIALMQQKGDTKSDLLLAWVAEGSLRDAREKEAYAKVEMFSIDSEEPSTHTRLVSRPPVVNSSTGTSAFAVPLSDIFSIQVRVPAVGWWFGSIIINTRTGNSFPALFFHDSECSSTIEKRKKYQRENFSISDMFWGGDQVLEWLKRYVTVERSAQELSIYLIDPSEADKASFGSGGKPTEDKVRNLLEGKDKDDQAGHQRSQSSGLDQVATVLKQARWNFLETMAQVTTFTRRTAQAVADNRNLPPQVRRLMQNPQVQTVSDEFDSARLYLARWAMGIAEQSEKERNDRIWFAKDVLQMENSEVGQFELLDVDAAGLSLADKRKPVTLKEWNGFFNSKTGRLERTPDEVKERIFHGGLSPDDGVRKDAWLFLLGVYSWDSTKEERHAHMNSLRDEYIRLKGAWWERMMDGTGTLEEREWWTDQKNRIGTLIPNLCVR